MRRDRLREWVYPLLIVSVGWAVASWFGATTWGVIYADEIFQTLEPAHKLVFSYGFETWESTYGGRNFTLNLLMALPYGLMALLGIDHPAMQVTVQRSLFALTTAAAAVGAWRLARIGGASRWWAGAACATVSWAPLQMAIGFRTFSEIPAAALLVWGVVWTHRSVRGEAAGDDARATECTDEDWARDWWFIAGMCCLGLSVLVRLQMAIAVAGVLLTWRVAGQMDRYKVGMRVIVVWALVYGLVDWIIFGLPFMSAGGYLRFHFVLSDGSAYAGINGPLFYPWVLLHTLGPGAVLMLLAPLSWSRWRGPVVGAGLFAAFHLYFSHRQVRFIWPIVPLLAGLGAVGFQVLVEWLERRLESISDKLQLLTVARFRTLVVALPVACLLGMAAMSWQMTPRMTMGDIGQADILSIDEDESVWGWQHEVNSLLLRAHEQTDLCGLRLLLTSAVNTGGYTFLHRDVPFYHIFDFQSAVREDTGERVGQKTPPKEAYNYIVARRGPRAPDDYRVVDSAGTWLLYDSGRDRCEPFEGYKARVFRPENME